MTDYAETALIRGLHFLAENQATIAHNLANVSSDGYKRKIAIASPSTGDFNNVGKNPSQAFTEALDWSTGSLNITGNRTHVAIKDDSFLKVQGGENQTYFARPSRLMLNADGVLVLPSGHKVLNSSDQEINLSTDDGSTLADMKISPNGVITNGRTEEIVASLGVYKIPEPAALRSRPGGLFAYTGKRPATVSTSNQIVQGALEQSNVQPTNELINMIAVQRSFAADMKALTTLGKIKDSYVATFNR